MKIQTTLLAFAGIALFATQLPAQQPANSPAHGHKKDGDGWMKKKDAFLDALPEDVRERFKAAREAAMQDPSIQALKDKAEAANKEFREAMRESIAKSDPELAQKVKARMEEFKKNFEDKGDGKKHKGGFEAAIQKLPPESRDKLEAARAIAKQAPSVQSAEAAMKSAQTPEALREAAMNYHKAMRDAILTADPSLAGVLDQIKPRHAEGAEPPAQAGDSQ